MRCNLHKNKFIVLQNVTINVKWNAYDWYRYFKRVNIFIAIFVKHLIFKCVF